MPLLTIVVVLIAVAILLYVINTYLSPIMDPKMLKLLNVVVVIIVVIWLLKVFGVFTYLSQIKL